MPAHKVSIIGSGNWGSAIARIIGENVKKFDIFDHNVRMYVYEEIVDGRKLTEIINTQHENVKYLPGYKLPENVVTIPEIVAACEDADVLVFVLPHKFIVPTCRPLVGKVKPGAIGLSLIKGFDIVPGGGGIELISNVIHKLLNIEMCVLMGANLAREVADEKFCETTIGCRDPENGVLLKKLIQTDYFRVTVVDDIPTIEVCGALKNVTIFGDILFCLFLLSETSLIFSHPNLRCHIMINYHQLACILTVFFFSVRRGHFFFMRGLLADTQFMVVNLRKKKLIALFSTYWKLQSIEELEKEMLNGQKLQGPETAEEVFTMLKNKNMLDRFPLFVAIHRICSHEIAPSEMIQCIKNHPEHM
ncbi:unnamed protein product [Ixodes persulcatus]